MEIIGVFFHIRRMILVLRAHTRLLFTQHLLSHRIMNKAALLIHHLAVLQIRQTRPVPHLVQPLAPTIIRARPPPHLAPPLVTKPRPPHLAPPHVTMPRPHLTAPYWHPRPHHNLPPKHERVSWMMNVGTQLRQSRRERVKIAINLHHKEKAREQKIKKMMAIMKINIMRIVRNFMVLWSLLNYR